MRKADKNVDDKLTQKELKDLLLFMNMEVEDDYAEILFKVRQTDRQTARQTRIVDMRHN